MTDPTLAAVQARAIAVCVLVGVLFLILGVVLLLSLRRSSRSDGLEEMMTLIAVAAFVSMGICVGVMAEKLPDAVAPLPAQEAPK